jgi:hypothetical protein
MSNVSYHGEKLNKFSKNYGHYPYKLVKLSHNFGFVHKPVAVRRDTLGGCKEQSGIPPLPGVQAVFLLRVFRSLRGAVVLFIVGFSAASPF